MASVDFKMTKSDNTDATVELIDGDGDNPKILLNFDDQGNASAVVNGQADYTAAWELIGKMGDTIRVTWSSGAKHGIMISDAIADYNSNPIPGGRRRAEDMGYLPAVDKVAFDA